MWVNIQWNYFATNFLVHSSAGLGHFTKLNISCTTDTKVKVSVRYNLQWRETTGSWLERATWKKRYRVLFKSIAFLQNQEKNFFLKKLTKAFNLILCFSKIPTTFIYVRARKAAFLSEDWRKLSVWYSKNNHVKFMLCS